MMEVLFSTGPATVAPQPPPPTMSEASTLASEEQSPTPEGGKLANLSLPVRLACPGLTYSLPVLKGLAWMQHMLYKVSMTISRAGCS